MRDTFPKHQIEYRRPSELQPYFNNPRKNEDAIAKVAESIQTFGFKQPIVIDADAVIIVGHTRYLAALKLELDEVPVIVADDLSPQEAKAYRIADNRTGEEAEWDYELLADELFDIDTDELFTGFDPDEIEGLAMDDIDVAGMDPDALQESRDNNNMDRTRSTDPEDYFTNGAPCRIGEIEIVLTGEIYRRVYDACEQAPDRDRRDVIEAILETGLDVCELE